MRPARAWLLASTLGVLVFSGQPSAAQLEEPRQVVLVVTDPLTYEEALRIPVVARIAGSGGIGLMTGVADDDPDPCFTFGAGFPTDAPAFDVLGHLHSAGVRLDLGVTLGPRSSGRCLLESAGPPLPGGFPALRPLRGRDRLLEVRVAGARGLGELQTLLRRLGPTSTLVVIAVPEASPAMRQRGDRVTPLVVGHGHGGAFAAEGGGLDGLTSDTTRRDGLVANVDVAPTILEFFGVPIPASMTGSPIRVSGEAPTDLHSRYLEYQRALRPIGITVLLVTLVALVAGGALLLFAPRAPRWLVAALAVAGLFGVALQVAMLPGSYLPEFDLPLVFGVLAGVAAAVTVVALVVGRAERAFTPVAVVGAAGVLAVAVDAALGWRSLETPLLGGSALDGVRFFGLGNSYAGVVLAGVVLVAALLPTVAGTILIVGAALFAGLPWVGADLGGGLTLFAVAGLWLALRSRERFDPAAVGIVVAAFVLGAAVIVGTHRLAEDATHVTRATSGPGGLAGIAETFWHRLRLNLESTAATPVVWPALLGLPAWLAVAWRRAGPFGPPLEARDAWRDAAIVLAVGGILGYVLNDTFGMASIAFLYLSLAMVYPALAVRWKSA